MRLKVDPSDSGGWYGIGCSRERGHAAVIEDVETADAEMVVVVGEELREILGLIFHCGVLSVLLGWVDRLIESNLPCRLLCIHHHPEVEAEGRALVRRRLLKVP